MKGNPIGSRPVVSRRDQRRYERRALELGVEIHEVDDHGTLCLPFRAVTRDLSRNGIGILSPRMVYVGRSVLLVLISARGEALRELTGIVRQVVYKPGVGHILGVEFAQIRYLKPGQRGKHSA